MSNEVMENYRVRLMDVTSLIPYARNARQHSGAQIAKLKALISEYGWTNPILADLSAGNQIIAGHGRHLAALELLRDGVQIRLPSGDNLPPGRVPVIDCSGWTEAQRRAYIIADNQSALSSSWDMELLKLELEDLRSMDFDLELTGFSVDELMDMLSPEQLTDTDPDEVPDVPEEPHSRHGDLWICGPHKVLCGSSTDMGDWDKLMHGELADLQVCDPPYNVAYKSDLAGSIKNDDMKSDNFRDFLRDFYTCSFAVMKPGAAMYVAHSDSEGISFREQFIQAGFKFSSCITWKKNNLVIGRLDYQSISEPILYGWKTGSKHRWYGGRKNISVQEIGVYPPFEKLDDGRYAIRDGDRLLFINADAVLEEKPTTIIYHDKPHRSALHPTMKPVGLWERLMKNSARHNDLVIDGFGGSGTTMVAADRLGMVSRLMELDPRFVDVICVRYHMLTGRVPVHAETGEAFPQEVIERLSGKCSDQ